MHNDDGICTICRKPVIYGVQPHHGATGNHFACEDRDRVEAMKSMKESGERFDAAIAKLRKAVAKR